MPSCVVVRMNARAPGLYIERHHVLVVPGVKILSRNNLLKQPGTASEFKRLLPAASPRP